MKTPEDIIKEMNWTYDSDPARFGMWESLIKPAMIKYGDAVVKESDSLSDVRESLSASEAMKRIGWQAEKIFAQNYAEVVSRSKAREMIRTMVAQSMADMLVSKMQKNKQVGVIKELGYMTLTDCSKIMGVSKQYLFKIKDRIDEKIFFNGKWWYKPLFTKKKDSL